jgi:molybdopterin converting factor subunit 1
VSLKLFALARERLGRADVVLEIPEPATVGRLRQAIAARHPELAPLLPSLLFSVNSEYAHDDTRIAPGAEVAAIPPVSGGSTGAAPAETKAKP